VKVLFAIDSLGGGGAERSLIELLPFLAEAGIDTAIVTLRHAEEGYGGEARSAGIPVVTLRSDCAAARVLELRREIAVERPDVLHTTLIASDVTGRLAAAGGRCRVLTSLVNTTYDPIRRADPNVSALGLAAVRVVDGWTARHLTDHFHAITHAVADAARASLRIPLGRITVVERGRDRRRLGMQSPARRAAARAALDLQDADQVLVAVGRQDWQKGHQVLLDALVELSPCHPRLILLLAGRAGHVTKALEQRARQRGLAERVRFLGHRDDLPDVLAASDLFVFPSLYEGLGGSMIEAMALGLPVVASDLPALREIVEPGGSALLVPPGQAGRLARAISTVLGAPDLAQKLGHRGEAVFAERYTIEVCAQRMIEMYTRVVA
jgi:glycosyltransferase involved in cell wall biosynthesis